MIWSAPCDAVDSRAPPRTAQRRAVTRSSHSAGSAGRSRRPPQRCGSSSPAARPRPHTAAWAGFTSGWSAAPAQTAPRVSAQSGACTPASPSAWTSATVPRTPNGAEAVRIPVPLSSSASARARRETTPSTRAGSSSASAAARAARPVTVTRATSAPHSVSARTSAPACLSSSGSPSGTATSQRPAGDTGFPPRPLRCQVTPYVQESRADRSRRCRRQPASVGSAAFSGSASAPPSACASASRSWLSTASQKEASSPSTAGSAASAHSSGQ